jgi:hypothetical protein
MESETIKGLTKTIDKLRKDNELLWKYKEAFLYMDRCCRELTRQLEIKRKCVRVIGLKTEDEKISYVLPIIDAIDTPDGMFIKVHLV